jgi:hypothetical protein
MQVQPNSAAPQVTGAIRRAANSTGASFDYLLATAQIESSLNPSAKAGSSSAQGLFQFIDQTWLSTMKRAGAALGLGQFSSAIVQGQDGRFEVPDTAARDAIMKMRADPHVSAMMAGAYTRNNAEQLTDGLGRAPSEGELYIAHFLGSDGASKLIGAALSAPHMNAAELFPQAASANRSIFYDRSGHPRGALDVYRTLTGRYEVARAGTTAAFDAGPLRGSLPANAPTVAGAQVQRVAAVPDTAGLTSAYADANPVRPSTDTKPLFEAMFTTRAQLGVSPRVGRLWAPNNTPGSTTVNTMDLFTDPRPGSRKLAGS